MLLYYYNILYECNYYYIYVNNNYETVLTRCRELIHPPLPLPSQWWGSEAVGKLVPHCHTVFFEGANHWLYLEEPSKFNGLVAVFAAHGFLNASRVLHL